MSNSKGPKWRLYLTLAGFAGLAMLVYGLRHQILEAVRELGNINAVALLLIIPLKFLNYDAYARLYRGLFAVLGNKVEYWQMYRLSLELNFVNYILPSAGISGISYFGLRSRAYGISASKGTLAQFAKMLLLYVSYQPLLIIGLVLLAMRNHVNDLVLITAASLITLLIAGTLFSIYM
ncbi:TPA: hypothetical protein DIS56_01270, partial [Candidatus Saccharibacteria bacterium]|nr:hypothetical protein [Candidatus Saccharibacteria bacterium]